ncbi:hypothetical protein Ahy_B07g086748 isoform B [Arachis hypogaea]|uniref:Uncharacterized protein n=2 Tax=Arachis hypogaea TaxID=3818 RepID=A0A444YAH5_ARAHY|nr:hypothetical protein Ahy_B07g086748 isoform B [Arachis hypogaea]
MLRRRACEGAKAKERKSAVASWLSGELLRARVVCGVTPCPCRRRALVPSREAAPRLESRTMEEVIDSVTGTMSHHRCCHQRKPLSLTQGTKLEEGRQRTREELFCEERAARVAAAGSDSVTLILHKLRLGEYKRDLYSLQKERENSQAMWSPKGKLIAILVCSSEC